VGTPFLSELRIMSFGFPPKGWALCNGQLLAINQNQALFSLLGTTYGGDGRINFGLPNLQGRVPIHMGNGFTLGQQAGEVAHTLLITEMPTHNHLMQVMATTANTPVPSTTTYLAQGKSSSSGNPPVNQYSTAASPNATFAPQAAISYTGGNQPHPNQQPYLVLSICIALQGIFPTQN
jgi:microcystin-dependent protein